MSDTPHDECIGLVGAGLLGTALAERLLAAGFRLVAHDLEAARVAALGANVRVAASAAQVAEECRRIVFSLPNSEAVAAVLGAMGGALRAGHVVIDTTTGEPSQAERFGAALAERGAAYLDATISGSSEQVRRGAGFFMVGGARADFERCADLWAAFGGRARHTGPCGSGSRMKLLTNLVLGLNRAALAEGLAFAGALGLDPKTALEVLRASAAYSRIMDGKGEKMVRGDFAPEARLSQHLKDVRLMLEAAARAGLALPLSEAHRALLEAAEAQGLGALDNSAIIRVIQKPPP